MNRSQRRKIVLSSVIAVSLMGISAYAESPENENIPVSAALMKAASSDASFGVSESSMFDVSQEPKLAGAPGQIENDTGEQKTEVAPSAEETGEEAKGGDKADAAEPVAMGKPAEDASLYLSTNDETMIKGYEGRTVSAVDIANVPDEVKSSLIPLIKTKPGDALTLDGVRADVSSLGSTGVFSQIVPSIEAVPEGVKLSYITKANPVIHSVEFSGNTVFTGDYLTELLGITPNSVLNTTLLDQKLQEIEKLYLQQGYLLYAVQDVKVTQEGVLKIDLAEGVIEDITIEGNDKTKDYVILRELRYKKGQPFNKFTASRSMERLYNLGFFEDVNMKLLPGTKAHSVITEIDVVEQKTGVVSIGAGYSESDGMVGILELGENNFRGTGDKIQFHWEFGGSSEGKNYQISYTRPWINDNGDSLGFSIFDRRYDYDDYNADGDTVASYDRRRKGFNLTWGHVSSEYRKNFFTLETARESYDDHDGFDWGSAAPAPDDETTRKKWYNAIMDNMGRTNSFTFTHVFDNRDNYFNASKGRRLSASFQYGGNGLGGDYDFYKFTTEGRFYKGLSNGHVLALRVMAGYISGETSYNQLFNLGGSNNLRGYEDDQFKGEKMYAATLEYRVPIAKKVEGVLFTDVGNAWSIDEGKIPWYQDDDALNWSVGVGLRLQTPIGPVRLDYGHGDKNKFHFSFGAQF